jgi:hypothetical protein
MYTVCETYRGKSKGFKELSEMDAYAIAKQVLKEIRQEALVRPQCVGNREVYVDFYVDLVQDVIATASDISKALLSDK